jgi:hypothetical protein
MESKKVLSKNVNFRASENIAEQLEKFYDSKGGGAERIVPGFFSIRKYTLHELKGKFTKDELSALIDAQNGVLLQAELQANKGVLLANVADFEKFGNGISRHKAKPDQLYKKIDQLTASQAYFLQNEIEVFWRGIEYKDLNDFIKRFS